MIIRFKVWQARRWAKHISKFNTLPIDARVNDIKVGTYRNGREIRIVH